MDVTRLIWSSLFLICHVFASDVDQLALLALKNNFVDDPDGILTSWNTSLQFCSWTGILCDDQNQTVTGLSLRGRWISGSLSPAIGNLSSLKVIDLSMNKLRGSIPGEIGKLSMLQSLNLTINSFTGEIPVGLTNCTALSYLSLATNYLTGNVLSEFGSMQNLQFLGLGFNYLSGEIPGSLGNLSSILTISFRENQLDGSIPSEIGVLKGLQVLRLSGNKLSGIIPISLYNLSSITTLLLSDNSLSGTLMPELGVSFPRLQNVYVGTNQFTGSIPPAVANITSLLAFDVSTNYLTGEVPGDLGNLKQLFWFNIANNSLGTGKSTDLNFLTSLANISSLRTLSFDSNSFEGILPNIVANLSAQLVSLSFGHNELNGSIPEEIGNLVSLIRLKMEYNRLFGVIPSSIGKLRNLGELTLSGNLLYGSIPSSIGNLTALSLLDMKGNQLEGNIPSSLKECTSLQSLYLDQNRLNGSVPGEILSHLNKLINLNLHQNVLSGSFPGEVGDLKYLRVLDVSSNRFSGGIPTELGSCTVLEYLRMNDNLFNGSLPESLSSLTAIQLIDLSDNDLSGSIPDVLQDLSGLQSLNVSFNQLDGEVPSRGVFANISAISLSGNRGLCGGIAQLKLPLCPSLSASKGTLSTKVIVAIITACVVFMAFLVGAVNRIYRGKRHRENPTSAPLVTEGYLRLTYKELWEATGGFAPANLIGTGSFGAVYRGILGQEERPIAVKVLNLEKHGALQSFHDECAALSQIRHRNVLKIITFCSSLDFRGQEFLALVFDFMPNGSLDNWLHELRNLSLGQRLDIAIHVASALDYLHHHCDSQIVHCDLKPRNILIDQDMAAHVGDFGQARILSDSNSHLSNDQIHQNNSSAIVGTIGYAAPEYGMGEKASLQGDVYSYGILLLEMMTGKRPTDDIFTDNMSLHTFVKIALPHQIMEILDFNLLKELEEAMGNTSDERDYAGKMRESLISILTIAVACSLDPPRERMDIGNVVKELQAIKEKLQ